ncbi:MAG: Crp/Fnr family transcriptional regulator [Rhizobiaceae bacterium]|nr:Crp/Fnr family transcriptional regulator [Rhizobiaceae bacterium]
MNQRADVHHPEPDGSVTPRLCEACEARHRGICGALTDGELLALSRVSGKRSLEPGENIISDADLVASYGNMLSGVAKLSKTLSDGRQQIVELQFAPDFLGRPFHKESHLTVDAATVVRLCTFPKSTFDKMVSGNPDLKQRLLDQSLRQLDEARDWMVTLGRKTAREKLASFLAYLARHVNPENREKPGGVVVELPLTRSDMADFLGLTIETVSRQLTALRKSNLINLIDSRHVEIRSMPRLLQEAGD